MEDVELIARFAEGDEEAFALLVRKWQKPVLNFLLKMVGNVDDARELFQETFANVYRKLPTLNEKERFSSWLFAIALNQGRMRFRKVRRSPRDATFTSEVEDVESRADSSRLSLPETPEEIFAKKEREQVVRQALTQIDERQREVILLKEYGGLKFVEIAEALELPLSTVKSRMYMGLESLRAAIVKILRV